MLAVFQIMDLRYPDIRILELNYPDFIDNELSGYYPDRINPDSITRFEKRGILKSLVKNQS